MKPNSRKRGDFYRKNVYWIEKWNLWIRANTIDLAELEIMAGEILLRSLKCEALASGDSFTIWWWIPLKIKLWIKFLLHCQHPQTCSTSRRGPSTKKSQKSERPIWIYTGNDDLEAYVIFRSKDDNFFNGIKKKREKLGEFDEGEVKKKNRRNVTLSSSFLLLHQN